MYEIDGQPLDAIYCIRDCCGDAVMDLPHTLTLGQARELASNHFAIEFLARWEQSQDHALWLTAQQEG